MAIVPTCMTYIQDQQPFLELLLQRLIDPYACADDSSQIKLKDMHGRHVREHG